MIHLTNTERIPDEALSHPNSFARQDTRSSHGKYINSLRYAGPQRRDEAPPVVRRDVSSTHSTIDEDHNSERYNDNEYRIGVERYNGTQPGDEVGIEADVENEELNTDRQPIVVKTKTNSRPFERNGTIPKTKASGFFSMPKFKFLPSTVLQIWSRFQIPKFGHVTT